MSLRARPSLPVLVVGMLAFSLTCAGARPERARGRGISREEYRSEMERALERVEKESRAARRGSVDVHANLFLAHEAFIASTPVHTLEKAVDAFKEAGVVQVDLNMGLFPWVDHDKTVIEKYDRVVGRIRGKGMRVAINPQYSPVRHRVHGLDEWREKALPVFEEVAGRYKPDVFVVVHEPSTMASRMGARGSTPEDWVAFAREAARVVRSRSSGSRIGAGGLASEQAFFEAFAKMDEIDVLTLDVYKLRSLPTYGEMIAAAKRENKPVYIEETWRPPYFQPRLGMSGDEVAVQNVGDEYFAPLDAEWMRAIAAWAGAMGVEGITPVWMQTFFAYGGEGTGAFDEDYLQRVTKAIDAGERTSTFEALRELSK